MCVCVCVCVRVYIYVLKEDDSCWWQGKVDACVDFCEKETQIGTERGTERVKTLTERVNTMCTAREMEGLTQENVWVYVYVRTRTCVALGVLCSGFSFLPHAFLLLVLSFPGTFFFGTLL